MSFTRPAWRSDLLLAVGALLLAASLATAQDRRECRFLCGPELKLEPTVTLTNVFRPARVVGIAGPMREERETEFEMILSLGMETRLRFLEFTLEAIVQPFDPDSTPELELEANLVWLPSERTAAGSARTSTWSTNSVPPSARQTRVLTPTS